MQTMTVDDVKGAEAEYLLRRAGVEEAKMPEAVAAVLKLIK